MTSSEFVIRRHAVLRLAMFPVARGGRSLTLPEPLDKTVLMPSDDSNGGLSVGLHTGDVNVGCFPFDIDATFLAPDLAAALLVEDAPN